MKSLFIKFNSICFLPLYFCIGCILWSSIDFPLHDFSNSYFPAHIVKHSDEPETIVFDIYAYNSYIWSLGYTNVLADFYLNSPFNALIFHPFTYLKDAYLAKISFNILGSILFLLALYALAKRFGKTSFGLIVLIPFLFFVPLRNQILFGQTYFLIFTLITFAFLWIEKGCKYKGIIALVFAALLKIFPVLYGIALIFKLKWKTIMYFVIIGLSILILSAWLTDINLWKTYFFDVIPNAISNKSTVNFQYNAQSVEVFLKTLFVKDNYYNPTALFNNVQLYTFIKWLWKSVIIGISIALSFLHKRQLFTVLSIWVVALFLVQSRTATYAQLLWIIPAFYMWKLNTNRLNKILFFILLFGVTNLPIKYLEDLPVFFKFTRLWLTIGLAIVFYLSINKKINFKYILFSAILFIPLHLEAFADAKTKDLSVYVLKPQPYFMIYDFQRKNQKLVFKALGKQGKIIEKTAIQLDAFDEVSCKIESNQVVYNGIKITNDTSLKKKPVLVNNCEVYYLTDSNSRRGAFTIKKINICNNMF